MHKPAVGLSVEVPSFFSSFPASSFLAPNPPNPPNKFVVPLGVETPIPSPVAGVEELAAPAATTGASGFLKPPKIFVPGVVEDVPGAVVAAELSGVLPKRPMVLDPVAE